MEDTEKLRALKRAYADIILNTAKEASCRVLMSERKALKFQQELRVAKDDSLRMLLRLKQMMDFKVKEVEIMSSTQQKKIEELDAQLREAEDIVRDLREELREVRAESEKARNNQLQHLDKQDLKSDLNTLEEPLQENGLESLASILFPSDPQNGPVTEFDILKSTSNQRCNPAMNSHMEVCGSGEAHFASLIMRNKEPELYRNGCTQRVRAFEGNMLDGKISFRGQEDAVKIETTISKTPTSRIDNSSIREELHDNNFCLKVLAGKNIRRKRKRTARYKKLDILQSGYVHKKAADAHRRSIRPCSKTCLTSLPRNAKSGENPSNVTEIDAPKDHEPCLPQRLPSDTTAEMGRQLGGVEVDESDLEILKPCRTLNADENNEGLVDNTESSAAPVNLVEIDEPLAGPDLKTSNMANEAPNQPRDDRFLKYTFTRKRKKVCMSRPDENVSLDVSTLKIDVGEKQNGYFEPQKSSLMVGSSRDSRRLAQVARQLISLSEKRW